MDAEAVDPEPTEAQVDRYRALAGDHAAGVAVVCARHRGKDHAATVTAFADVSYAPPTMLVCLYDLGRICEPGTVAVHEFMNIHRYSHIMHLEAAVSGRVAKGRTALEATLSCFPAGTLSGAPKVRAMEIIDALEVSRRGLYGGVVGYFDFAGNSA